MVVLLVEVSGSQMLTEQTQCAGDVACVRCERQTITRLPQTHAILFTVRTYIRTLEEAVGSRPELAADLFSALAHRPDCKARTHRHTCSQVSNESHSMQHALLQMRCQQLSEVCCLSSQLCLLHIWSEQWLLLRAHAWYIFVCAGKHYEVHEM